MDARSVESPATLTCVRGENARSWEALGDNFPLQGRQLMVFYSAYSSIKDPGRKQVSEVESGPEEG